MHYILHVQLYRQEQIPFKDKALSFFTKNKPAHSLPLPYPPLSAQCAPHLLRFGFSPPLFHDAPRSPARRRHASHGEIPAREVPITQSDQRLHIIAPCQTSKRQPSGKSARRYRTREKSNES